MRSAHQPKTLGTVSSLQNHGTVIQHKPLPKCYVIGGVSGSGKSTVGRLLADRLNCPFFEGDDYHPRANKDKMHSRIPLEDEDRWPWLNVLADIIHQQIIRNEMAVVACSALKQKYRDVLSGHERGQQHVRDVAFVLLQPNKEVLAKRVQDRAALGSHFMPASLLESQLALVETDPTAYTYDVQPPEAIVDDLMALRQSAQ